MLKATSETVSRPSRFNPRDNIGSFVLFRPLKAGQVPSRFTQSGRILGVRTDTAVFTPAGEILSETTDLLTNQKIVGRLSEGLNRAEAVVYGVVASCSGGYITYPGAPPVTKIDLLCLDPLPDTFVPIATEVAERLGWDIPLTETDRVGAVARNIRVLRGKTIDEVARFVRVDRDVYTAFEAGDPQTVTDLDLLQKISEAFGVGYRSLLPRETMTSE